MFPTSLNAFECNPSYIKYGDANFNFITRELIVVK